MVMQVVLATMYQRQVFVKQLVHRILVRHHRKWLKCCNFFPACPGFCMLVTHWATAAIVDGNSRSEKHNKELQHNDRI